MGFPSVGTSAYFLAEEAGKCGCRMIVVSASFDRVPGNAWKRISTLEILGKRVPFRLVGRKRAREFHDYRAASVLRKLRDSVDAVHCWPGSSLRTLQVAKELGIPTLVQRTNAHTAFAYQIVAREHEKLGIKLPSSYSHFPDQKRLDREEAEYQLADRILVPSDFVYRTFKDRGFGKDKLIRMFYGYDPKSFYLPPGGIKERSNEKFVITFVGRAEPRKGLHYALEAWSNSELKTQTIFRIVGNMNVIPGYINVLGRWLNQSNVQILGEIDNVGDVLRDSDVLVLPAVEEGSAKVTFEARACGCVIVVSDCTGAECTHMYDGLIHPARDVETLREHLLTLFNDRELYRYLRENSIKTICNFTWENAARRLMRVYKETVFGKVSRTADDYRSAQ